MDTNSPIATETKKNSTFVIVWLSVFALCLLTFLVTVSLAGYGLYKNMQTPQVNNPQAGLTATAASSWPVILTDNFQTDANRWDVGNYENGNRRDNREIGPGFYRWSLENAAGYTYWQPASLGNLRDFTLSVSVRHISGTQYDQYGVIFCNNAGNHYVFAIQDSGDFIVSGYIAGEYKELIPTKKSTLIKPGKINHLGVVALDGKYTLFINGAFAGEFKDNSLSGGDVAMMVGPEQGPSLPDAQPQGISTRRQEARFIAEFSSFEVRAPAESVSYRSSTPSLPPIKPGPGRLVFGSNQGGQLEIYTIASDGTNLKQLTDNQAADYAPRWSPDGKQIAFCSERDGNAEIYVMEANGTNLRRLTFNPKRDCSPDWSPDGSQIIFSSNRDGKFQIYLMPAAGEKDGLQQITHSKDNETNPIISPDGQKILFQVKMAGSNTDLYVMGIDGKKREVVGLGYDNAGYVDGAWDPAGKRIAYVQRSGSYGDIMVSSLKNDNSEQDWRQITPDYTLNQYPGWSPDGSQLVYVGEVNGQPDIYIILANGSGIFRVTNDQAIEKNPDWTAP